MDELLDGLFKWSCELTLVDSFGEPVLKASGLPWAVWQRIVGDSEVDLARKTALRASAIVRRKLRDPSNFDRLLIIPEYDKLERGDLIALLVLIELGELRNQAARDMHFPFPEPLDSESTLEEQEAYQNSVDTYFERREEKLSKKVSELAELRRLELGHESDEKLRVLHENQSINNTCQEEMVRAFNEMVTYLATYTDPEFTKRAFSSFNSFKNASSHIKEQLMMSYAELELSGDKLKK